MHTFLTIIHLLTFQNEKWAANATFVPKANTTFGNLQEEDYMAPEVSSLYKAFCLGMRHQSKTPYWTRKLETIELESLRKKILDREKIELTRVGFDEVIYEGNVYFSAYLAFYFDYSTNLTWGRTKVVKLPCFFKQKLTLRCVMQRSYSEKFGLTYREATTMKSFIK